MSFKKYSFLRNILAKRLKAKKREIEAIKAKNRIFVSGFGLTINLENVDNIKLHKLLNSPNVYVLKFLDKKGNIIQNMHTLDKDRLIEEYYEAAEQLKQLKAYD